MAKVDRVGSAFSTLPFDGIDNVSNWFFHDDFVGGLDVADGDGYVAVTTAVGNYRVEEVVGDSAPTIDAVAGVADHPGIARLSTGATTPADGDVASLTLGATADPGVDGDILLDSNGVYVAAVIRIPDVDAQKVEFGLIGQAPAAPNSSAADVVSFVWDPEDAANVGDELFLAQINSAGTDTEEAFSIGYVESDWVLLEIAADDTSAYFRLTTEDASETIALTPAAMPLVALTPVISVEADGAAEEYVDIDVLHVRYERKQALRGKQDDWLGA